MRLRGFVPLDELIPPAPAAAAEPAAEEAAMPPAILVDAPDRWETRATLFGEIDP